MSSDERADELASIPDRFADRRAGGRALAGTLAEYAGGDDVLVLALPRGGVPVAYEVATALDAPLDLCCVQRFGAPGYPEYAMGAVASGGATVLNQEVIQYLAVPAEVVRSAVAEATAALQERERALLPDPSWHAEVRNRTVLLVDDGLCTGATLRAAALALRVREATRIIGCVPTAWPLSRDDVLTDLDDIVSVIWPNPFGTVSRWYEQFGAITDGEVRDLVSSARAR